MAHLAHAEMPDPTQAAIVQRIVAERGQVLHPVDTLTRDGQVGAPKATEVRWHFSDREVVELVATIAAYTMVSRFLAALPIHGTDERGGTGPA